MKKPHPPRDPLWTVKDVMFRLSIGHTCAAEIIKSLPHVKIGRSYRVHRQDVEDWISRHSVTPTAQLAPAEKPRRPKKRPPMPGFDENGKLLRRRHDHAATRQPPRSA